MTTDETAAAPPEGLPAAEKRPARRKKAAADTAATSEPQDTQQSSADAAPETRRAPRGRKAAASKQPDSAPSGAESAGPSEPAPAPAAPAAPAPEPPTPIRSSSAPEPREEHPAPAPASSAPAAGAEPSGLATAPPDTAAPDAPASDAPAESSAQPHYHHEFHRSGGRRFFKTRRFFKRGRFRNGHDRHYDRHHEQSETFQPARPAPEPGGQPGHASGGAETAGSSADPAAERVVETFPCEGVLELSGKGFGFLRERSRAYQQHPQDVFVTPELVRRHGLRDGMLLAGRYRRSGRGPQMVALDTINGGPPERFKVAPLFEELTALNPERRIRLETTPDRHTTRVIDLIAPIGRGQRGLIVAPPRTGKTTLLMHIAEAVLANHPDLHLLVLLVDERPEEVTEFKINLPQAELWASSNDSDVKSHTRIATLCLERAKRMVEDGQHVFLILDSITRVGRAFNNAIQGTGRTLTGGMDARGMEIPRRLFAAARNTEEAGSLTIIATALIETGSRMDELIFQEFKGTGNMELVLDRRIAEQRIYPAVDIFKSGTRREELLVPEDELEKISVIRRGLAGHKPVDAIERLLFFIRKFPTNKAMLDGIPR